MKSTEFPSAQLFQLMAERVLDYAIFLLDPGGHILSWNAGAAAIKKYAAGDVIGRHFSMFYTVEDIARGWPAHELQQATIEGRFEDEGWRVRKDGSRFWANVIITALRDDHGTLLAFSKITRDLTERKKHEEALRLSEERFRLLVDGVRDYAIYMLNPEGIIVSWNSGARRIKGFDAAEVIGKHFSRFYTTDDIEGGRPWTELAMAREHGRAEDEGWRVRKDGSQFWARVVLTALYDTNGKLHGFAKVTQDLTQRKHAETLQTSVSQINDFIAVLAHELRNPLAPIRNAVHLLKTRESIDATVDMTRRIIDRQSGQLSRMVDDLLDISRVTRGTLSIHETPMDITALVNRAIETSRPHIEAAKHRLEIDLPPHSPRINGDELRLTQALANLLNNAARYTDPGGTIYVSVSERETGSNKSVCVSVADTGRGIEPAMLDSVFGMFVQGKDTLHRASGGLGVGLALARSIVELHHGTLTAKSEGAGKGAEFTICLPLLKGTKVATPEPVASISNYRDADVKKNPRIMVVDDNSDAAETLGMLLQMHGYEVVAVNNAMQALQVFEEFQPEIVLLDIGMPGMNGLELARRLRQRNRNPRPYIVAITGWNTAADEARSKEAGFDLHLAKPVEESEILKILTHSRRIH